MLKVTAKDNDCNIDTILKRKRFLLRKNVQGKSLGTFISNFKSPYFNKLNYFIFRRVLK